MFNTLTHCIAVAVQYHVLVSQDCNHACCQCCDAHAVDTPAIHATPGAYLFKIEAMIDVMCSDVDLDVREMAVHGPHCSVVGTRAVQCDDST